MTIAEKIKILEKEKEYMLSHGGDIQAEALTSAIKALEQERCDVFDEYGNYKYSSDVELTEPNTATSMPCSNAISRIEAIKKFTYNYKGERIPDYDCDNFPIQIDMKRVKEILRELPPVNPQSKWIPVSEGLPNRDEYIKNNGLFIVSDGNRSYSEWFDIYGKQRFGEPTMSGFRVDYAVTAWMPLPEPYRKDCETK